MAREELDWLSDPALSGGLSVSVGDRQVWAFDSCTLLNHLRHCWCVVQKAGHIYPHSFSAMKPCQCFSSVVIVMEQD